MSRKVERVSRVTRYPIAVDLKNLTFKDRPNIKTGITQIIRTRFSKKTKWKRNMCSFTS